MLECSSVLDFCQIQNYLQNSLQFFAVFELLRKNCVSNTQIRLEIGWRAIEKIIIDF